MAEADSALMGMAGAAGRRVVVDIHPHGHLQQELLAGIAAAAREQGWDLRFLPGLGREVAAGQPGPEGLPDGIVALSASAVVAEALAGLPCPVVELGRPAARWPLPEVDEEAAGRLAALHLQERGYPRLAFLGEDAAADAARGRGFAAGARAALAGELRLAAAELVRSRGDERIIPWLTRLPLPCGIFASTDRLALALAALAFRHGLQLPEELGIIAAGGDPLLSSLSPVPLSSVRLPYREQGQQAARLLGELMAGRPPSACPPLVPTEVVAQRSSDRREHADALVAAARAWIAAHLGEAPGVDAIAEVVGANRRTLERRFQRATGRSVLAEVQRQRLARGCILLRSGTSVQDTAAALGLTANRFIAWFHQAQGCTPGSYQRMWGA